MSKICDLCGKRPRSGQNVSHSQRKTKRRFLPNLQWVKMKAKGASIKLRVCTQCVRTLDKQGDR